MQKREIAFAAVIVSVMVVSMWDPVIDPFLHRERYRGQVRTLYDNLQLGMNKEQVRHEMESGKYPHLNLHRESQLWLGSAPLEFGAGHWVLAIEFQGDEVSAVRVRRGDGLQELHRPAEAPPDKTRRTVGSD